MGNLLGPKTPPDPGCLREIPESSISKDKARDLDEQSTAGKSDTTTTGLRLLVSSWLSSGGDQGKTAVSVHFWQGMGDDFVDGLLNSERRFTMFFTAS
jgi:hypothetical protein